MNKLLTIVIPTYNMQDYLRRCLESLILPANQIEQLDVLVVNDGSKDNSSAIAHEYEAKYPNSFHVIDKENGNYGSCVNRGLQEATGKYFRILDADDYYDTDALAQFVDILGSNDSDVVFTRCVQRDMQGKILKDEPFPQIIKLHTELLAPEFDAVKIGYWPFAMHTMTYKTSVLRDSNLQLSTGISYTDNEYIFYPLEKVKTLWFEDIALYQYTVGREGQTMTPELMRKRIGHFEKILDRMLEYYDKNNTVSYGAIIANQQGVIFSIMRWMYALLLNAPMADKISAAMLHKLDSQVNARPEFIDRVSAIERYGFRYVEYWHRTQRTCTHPLTQLYLQWHRGIRKIKSLLK